MQAAHALLRGRLRVHRPPLPATQGPRWKMACRECTRRFRGDVSCVNVGPLRTTR